MFIGASPSLKSLCCLRDGVCYPPVPLASLTMPREKEREREEESEVPTSKGTRKNEPVVVGRAREAQGTGEIYLPGRIAVAKSSQESDKPTTEAYPPHYAHRSRDFNVPLEMAACCLAASVSRRAGEYPTR